MRSKYETHVLPNLEHISMWAEEGATNKTIAKLLKIDYSTFRRYLAEAEQGNERYLALYKAFADARAVANEEVETALHKRATGYDYNEDTMEWKKDPGSGEMKLILTKRVKKHVPPDPTSAMFWLTNQMPKKWAYKPEAKDQEDGSTGVVQLTAQDPEPEPDQGDREALAGKLPEAQV